MTVIDRFDPTRVPCGKPSTVTLGTFDGVHIGHAEILRRVVERARRSGTNAVVATFDRHPASVLNHRSYPGILTTREEKLRLFEAAGIDTTCVIEFTKRFAETPEDEFIRAYLVSCLAMKGFVVGYDHGFGKGRKGTAAGLAGYARAYGFDLDIVDPVVLDGTEVKSSTIRSLILEGDVGTAAKLLGRGYSIAGTVVHGAGIGKPLGFPTANIQPDDPEKIIPAPGVYTGCVETGGMTLPCVMSVGPRPTFDIEGDAFEVHIPDFSGDLYDARLRVFFSMRLRGIVKFQTREELIDQIRQDIQFLKSHIAP